MYVHVVPSRPLFQPHYLTVFIMQIDFAISTDFINFPQIWGKIMESVVNMLISTFRLFNLYIWLVCCIWYTTITPLHQYLDIVFIDSLIH